MHGLQSNEAGSKKLPEVLLPFQLRDQFPTTITNN
jgi:hypothetical protein